MFILSLNLIFPIIVCFVMKSVALTNHSFNFKDDVLMNLEKCCFKDSVLDNTEKCIKITNKHHLEISSPKISNYSLNYCKANLDCIDFKQDDDTWQLVRISGANCKTEIVEKYKYFPKCCPIGFAYDRRGHNCVQTQNGLRVNDYLQVIKVSLSHCPIVHNAIVDLDEDFEIDQEKKTVKMKYSGKTFDYGSYCIDRNVDSDKYIIRACVKRESVCGPEKGRCLWKCCPDGEIYKKIGNATSKCSPAYTHGINISILDSKVLENNDDFNFRIIISDYLSVRGKHYYQDDMEFKIDAFGNTMNEQNVGINKFTWDSETYCIETIEKSNSFTQRIKIVTTALQPQTFIIYGIILLISSLFLIVTILCYMFLPEMKNLHGKCIMTECIFLLVASGVLCWLKLVTVLNSSVCIFLGYVTIYAFLGVFAWLNVICVDMWMTFGVLRGFNAKAKKDEMKKFIMYCLYGFGVPTIITGFMILSKLTRFLPESFLPHIGTTICYFDINYPETYDYLLYFIIPMATMIFINVVLFVKTTMYCIKVKNEIQRMREAGHSNEKGKRTKRFNSDKENVKNTLMLDVFFCRMMMLLKLFMIMGIPWVFEALSSIISFKQTSFLSYLEIIVDIFNCAKGFFIFCIFILKRKVLNSLKSRFGIKSPERQSTELSSLTMTTTTR